MKKTASISIFTLVLIFLVSSIAPATALADSGDIKSGSYTYRVESGSALIVDYTGPGGDVVIPSKIDGYDVTSLAVSSFEELPGVTSVTMPDSVTSIGACVFINNRDLVTVNLSASLGFMDTEPFYNCPKLTAINVHSSSTHYASVDGVLYSKDMSKLFYMPGGYSGSFTIPAGVTKINADAFSKCEKLTSISTIGSGVTEIGRLAFYECTKLSAINVDDANPNYSSQGGVLFNKGKTTLIVAPIGLTGTYNVPGSVTRITEHAFNACRFSVINLPASVTAIEEIVFPNGDELTAINAAAGNPNYRSIDGVLFTKDLSKLIAYPAGRDKISGAASIQATKGSFTVPGSVKEIGASAFEGCAGLKKVTIPKSVAKIGSDAFKNCGGLAIYGYTNSYAQKYAQQNGISFVALDKRVTVSVKANRSSYGTVKGACRLYAGESATLTAAPKPGRYFVRWYAGKTTVSKDYRYKTKVYGNITFTAEFASIARPKINSASLPGDKKVKLSWGKVKGAVGYIVYRYTKKSSHYDKKINCTGTSFTDSGLKAGKVYYYRIKACCTAGSVKTYSDYSPFKATQPVR